MSMTTPLRKGPTIQTRKFRTSAWIKGQNHQIVEQLAEGHAERLIQKVVELAEAGDVACLRMILDRLWPPRKGQPVNVNMPPINDSQDVPAAILSIWTALREGRITPDEANALSGVVDRSIQAIELKDMMQRIENLEKAWELTK